jgi:hypothetical protein
VLTSELMNDTLKNPSLWEFSGIIEKQSKKYGGHDLQKAVNHKMNTNSKSFRNKHRNPEITANSYTDLEINKKKFRTVSTNSAHPSLPDQVYGGQQQTTIGASTMIGKYGDTIPKNKRKTGGPKTVVKNGKLLISKNKTIA